MEKGKHIAIIFETPEAGWLQFEIRTAGGISCIHASHIFDPFPDYIRWLEKLTHGEYTQLSINEEGVYHKLMIFPEEGKLIRFVSVCGGKEAEIEIDVLMVCSELIGVLYWGLINFFESDEYEPAEWESLYIHETISKFHPGKSREEIVDWLMTLGPQELLEEIWKADPIYAYWIEEGESRKSYYVLPNNWMYLSKGEQRQWIDEAMDERCDTRSWHGSRLGQLRSPTIEDWLVSMDG